MTFTVGTPTHDSISGSGSLTFAHEVLADDTYLVVTTVHNWEDNYPTGVTYDGVAMTRLRQRVSVNPKAHLAVWLLTRDNGLTTGTSNVVVARGTAWDTHAVAISGKTSSSAGPALLTGGDGAGASGGFSATVDGGGLDSRVFTGCKTYSEDTPDATANLTEDWSDDRFGIAHETSATQGSRSVGWSESYAAWLYVLLVDTVPDIDGSHVGMSVGVHAGALTYEGILQLPYRRVRGLVLGLRHGAFSFTAKRQVALVGEGIETSENTEGGTEGQVLTQHIGRKPTWEDAGGGASELDDLTDVNAPSPSDNDVLAWDDGAGEWAPMAPGTPDLSAGSLDDLGDVNVPDPDDGDVLTWNDYLSEWEAAAPSGGVDELGDLSDVTVTGSETDGQVLTSDGAGGFAFEDAAGGGWPPVAPAAYVQRASNGGSTNALALTLGAAPTVGNILILTVGRNANDVTSITQTNVTWTKLDGHNQSTATYCSIWKGVIAASALVGITVNGSNNQWTSAQVVELEGISDLTLVGSGKANANSAGAAYAHRRMSSDCLAVGVMSEDNGSAAMRPFMNLPYHPLTIADGTGAGAYCWPRQYEYCYIRSYFNTGNYAACLSELTPTWS